MTPVEKMLESFVSSAQTGRSTTAGTRVIGRLASEVIGRSRRMTTDYNERYIDGGPKWGEHINYNDGGQHGETHRPK